MRSIKTMQTPPFTIGASADSTAPTHWHGLPGNPRIMGATVHDAAGTGTAAAEGASVAQRIPTCAGTINWAIKNNLGTSFIAVIRYMVQA